MPGPFLSIFIDVVLPVFVLVLIGYVAGPRLRLESRTLSKAAYYLFIPAFVFSVISSSRVQLGQAARMVVYIILVHLACALLALLIGKLLGRPREIIAAYVLVAVFGNVGNYGLSIIKFGLGEAALAPATIYLLGINIVGFGIGVTVATSGHANRLTSMLAVFKTPALLALPPAIAVSATGFTLPLMVTRATGLLGQAMIPVMLVTLGIELAKAGRPRIDLDVLAASGVRLLGGPVLAVLFALPFGLAGLERSAGILQAAMPAAILTSIIAIEHDLVPRLVITIVLFSTLASLLTLTVLLALI